jgi:hypothetical protein
MHEDQRRLVLNPADPPLTKPRMLFKQTEPALGSSMSPFLSR